MAADPLGVFDVNPAADPVSWISQLLASAAAGDLLAATMLLLATYVVILVINRLTQVLLVVIGKLMVFAIIAAALYSFLTSWTARIAAGVTATNLVLGAVGLLAGVAAFAIALYALAQSASDIRKEPEKSPEEVEREAAKKEVEETKKEVQEIKQILTMQSLKDDKSLGAVLAYMAVAQFGIFSSKTISAPSATVGAIFFVIFLALTGFFIRLNYKSFRLGITHFSVALVAGFILSLILGATWGNMTPAELLSPTYFESDSLVALMTGIAIPIFMGSKK